MYKKTLSLRLIREALCILQKCYIVVFSKDLAKFGLFLFVLRNISFVEHPSLVGTQTCAHFITYMHHLQFFCKPTFTEPFEAFSTKLPMPFVSKFLIADKAPSRPPLVLNFFFLFPS